MDYKVFRMSNGEGENSTEAHVFARAYREAWRFIHGSEPAGRHLVAALKLILDFGAPSPARVRSSHADTAPTTRRTESASTAVDVPPGASHDN